MNMPHIPQEILNIIIGYATAYWPDFSSYAISHTFHQIVLPYKFRSLTFGRKANIRGAIFSIPEFFKAINAGDTHALSLASLVQELTFVNWSGFGYDYLIKDMFEEVMNSFRNLTKLSMETCVHHPGTTWQTCETCETPVITVAHIPLERRFTQSTILSHARMCGCVTLAGRL